MVYALAPNSSKHLSSSQPRANVYCPVKIHLSAVSLVFLTSPLIDSAN